CEELPGRDVEGGDAGCAPARGEIIQIDARAVGGIEEGPEPIGAEWRIEPEIAEGVEEVREALVAAFAGRDGDPKDGAGAAPETGGEGSFGPPLTGEGGGGF